MIIHIYAKVSDNLSYGALFEIPIFISWFDIFGTDRYENIYPDYTKFSVDEIVAYTDGEYQDEKEAQADLEEYFYENIHHIEPMLNYYYPLPYFSINENEAQAILVKSSTSCVLVKLDDEIVLSLNGCGMDFSWQICKAYMLLGYLPPFHFCDLPEFAGGSYMEEDIKQACTLTCSEIYKSALARHERICDI